jgi:hypothetical protein
MAKITHEYKSDTAELIANALAALMAENLAVRAQLMAKIQNGFFEKPQPRSAIQALAYVLLEASRVPEGKDAR